MIGNKTDVATVRASEPEVASASAPQTANGPPLAAVCEPELTQRNALHPVRGTLVALLGAALPFLIMASDRHWSFSVPVGMVSCLVATWGLLDLLGTFDDPAEQVVKSTTLSQLWPRLVELVAGVVALVAVLRLSVAGVLPKPVLSSAVLVTGSFLWVVVSVFRVGQGLGLWVRDEAGNERPLLRRHGFWLVALNAALYLPLLGSFSLSDPWETHYGEVAREMLARDDWISLWWAQDGWFWSKPVLDFWMQGLSFALLGVRFLPDQMLAGAADGRFPQPEWAARVPVFLMTVVAAYVIYKAVARVYGRRAGLLGGIVLTTMPYWFLIGHQTMTDMPYVAPLTAAMGLLLIGFHTDPEQRVKSYELSVGSRVVRLSAYHLLFTVIVLTVLPQVLYLLTRNVTLQVEAPPFGFRPHADEFFLGSGGGNCGLPGNEACRTIQPVNKLFQPWMSAVLWSAMAALLLWVNRGERRLQRLFFLGAWYMMALSATAKGAPGLVLPVFVAGAYVVATRRFKDLTRLELPSMLLITACIVLPWYFAMYMRHGQPFTDRLLFHDMYKRAFVHVHDTNVGDDVSFRYYVWQLGYGLFPWTGLAAAGLVWWLRRDDEQRDAKADVSAFFVLWFVAGFSMFTITLTKFHHYVFPVVPPIAMLAGILVDRVLDHAKLPSGRQLAGYLAGVLAATALLLYGTLRLMKGSVFGSVVDRAPPGPSIPVALVCLSAGAGLVLWTLRRTRAAAPTPDGTPVDWDGAVLGALGLASAIVVGLAGRDMFTSVTGDIQGQARLMHLFTYNYRRPWPDSLEFDGMLAAFTVVAAGACALLAFSRWRAHAGVLLASTAVVWAAWGVNVYLFRAAPHWGQRETVLAYYRNRKGPEEPLVSYQMNWKGENFYTGNRTPAFVSSGEKFKSWIAEQRKGGTKVVYFTTEHGRIGSLKNEIGPHKKVDVITTPQLNNKFMVARVEL
jgi:4-amino-4-deoxy-L-arabinose transferase-like glycosyltransferase